MQGGEGDSPGYSAYGNIRPARQAILIHDARLIFEILVFSKNNNFEDLISMSPRGAKGKLDTLTI